MAKQYKLVVKRLPRKVCVSIRAAKGSTLTKRKYVKRSKSRKRGKRRRKMKWITYYKKCAKAYRGKSRRKPRSVTKACAARYRAGKRP